MTALRLGISVVLCWTVAATGDEPIEQANRQFDQGNYTEGCRTLTNALDTMPLTVEQRARIRDSLARFYEDVVGSEFRPRLHWQAVVDADLRRDHPLVVDARKQLVRLAANDEKYAEPDEVVADANFLTDDRDEIRARIADLKAVAEKYPDYPHMARLYHTVGVNHMWLKEYGPAIDAFDQALEIRPAIDLIHPTSAFRATAVREWMHENVPTIAWSVVIGIGGLWAIAFVALRRWRKLRGRDALIASIVLAGWCAVFFGTVAIVKDFEFPQPVEAFATPIEIHTSLGQTGAETLISLFWYGLAAVVGSVLFTTVSGAIRRGTIRFAVNLLVSLALSGAMMTLAYLAHVSRDAVYLRSGHGAKSYLTSTFNFHVRTIPLSQPDDESDQAGGPGDSADATNDGDDDDGEPDDTDQRQ